MTGVRRSRAGATAVLGTLLVAGCSAGHPSGHPSPRQSPATTVTATKPPVAASLPASPRAGPLQPESCQRVADRPDGSPGPVLCPDGHPNAYALPALQRAAPDMLSLGQSATLDDVETAECADLSASSTKPIEEQAYKFAKALNGWAFTADPTAGGIFYVCLPP